MSEDAFAMARRMAAEKEGQISREYFTGIKPMTDYERGFTEAIEKAVDVLGAYLEYDRPMCCDGRECGCQGASVFDMIKHYIRALSPSHDTVRVPREPTEEMLRAGRHAVNGTPPIAGVKALVKSIYRAMIAEVK